MEAEIEDDFFVLREFDACNQADQKRPIAVKGLEELLYQRMSTILCRDRASRLLGQFTFSFFQCAAVSAHTLVNPCKIFR